MHRMKKARLQLGSFIAVGLALFLLVLPFHLVVKRVIPGPVGTYWKEMLLGLLVALWAVRCLLERRFPLSGTPLDLAVLAYLGLMVLRFLLDRSGWVGAWGLYVSAMYLPLFWLVPAALRHRPSWVTVLVALLVGIGAVAALGGLAEFMLDRPLWPSNEMVQRQGFADVFIYGTRVRRVYFTFDSPTTLANTLALLFPLALILTLPSSLSLVEGGRRTVMRLAAGLTAVVVAACIVVTFSRGIWVATVFSLLAMGLVTSYVQRNWRILLGAAGVVALIGLAWGLAAALRTSQTDQAYRGILELSAAAYEAAQATGVNQELLREEPTDGAATGQTWTLLDPITGEDDTRAVLYEHPTESGKEEIIYRVTVPEAGALRFAIALSPEVWSPERGDGASFQIHVAEPDIDQKGQFVFVRYINPKHNPSDRRWRNFLVDLSPWAGRAVNLGLITESGPAGDWAFDWAGWAELQIVRVAPDTFVSAKMENAVVRHTGSILDWSRDETNRDRLAAWSLALSAWREAPLWGSGLGSTGVAALRTDPERAFVTESQVLKALVELGLPGLLTLAYLWFQIARVGYRAYRGTDDPDRRVLLIGILTSLLVVFVEGWVYQNLEVKQVNAYFWTLVGTLVFLTGNQDA